MKKTAIICTSVVAVAAMFAPTAVSAANNYLSATKTVTGRGSASCPTGWKVTGGGVMKLPDNRYGTSTSNEYVLQSSYPSGERWVAEAIQVFGTYSTSSGWHYTTQSYGASVKAVCIK